MRRNLKALTSPDPKRADYSLVIPTKGAKPVPDDLSKLSLVSPLQFLPLYPFPNQRLQVTHLLTHDAKICPSLGEHKLCVAHGMSSFRHELKGVRRARRIIWLVCSQRCAQMRLGACFAKRLRRIPPLVDYGFICTCGL